MRSPLREIRGCKAPIARAPSESGTADGAGPVDVVSTDAAVKAPASTVAIKVRHCMRLVRKESE
jgi:hypothetical protein